MAEIYDFVKYLSEKEISMYETENDLGEFDVMCYGCHECENPTFMLTTAKEILCAECGIQWGAEE